MLVLFHDRPFMPHSPPRDTPYDLNWWAKLLRSPTLSRSIPGPTPLEDANAFSDASSGFGIGITIGERWRAWHLLPNWNSEGCDIGWAEAISFELLVLAILSPSSSGTDFKVYGDNKGVVEGWWKGRSRNKQTNLVFRHIHTIMHAKQSTVHTRYVPSKENPANRPSRGIYPAASLLLRKISIPPELCKLIIDFDHRTSSMDPRHPQHDPPTVLPKPHRLLSDNKRATLNAELDCRGEEFFASNPQSDP